MTNAIGYTADEINGLEAEVEELQDALIRARGLYREMAARIKYLEESNAAYTAQAGRDFIALQEAGLPVSHLDPRQARV